MHGLALSRIQSASAAAGLISLGMGIQAFFFPRPGHEPSIVSLAAAGGLGLVYLASVYVGLKLDARGGRIMAAAASLFLVSHFLPRVILGRAAIYPDFLMAAISGSLLIALIAIWFRSRNESITESRK
jgi:uncharacterized membrane protein (UPF0136 family)